MVEDASPRRQGGEPGSVRVDFVPVELTSTGIDIHLLGPKPSGTLPEVATSPEEQDHGESKVRLEETLSSSEPVFARRSNDSRIELDGLVSAYLARSRTYSTRCSAYLGNKDENTKDQTEP